MTNSVWPVIGDCLADEDVLREARDAHPDAHAKKSTGRPHTTWPKTALTKAALPKQAPSAPIYLRHRFHGELGQLLQDYYADVLDQALPDQLLALVESLRHKERSR